MSVLDMRQDNEGCEVIERAHTAIVTVGTPIFLPGVGAAIPLASAAANPTVATAFRIRGRYRATITSAVTVAQGDPLYYDSSATTVQKLAPAAGFYIGVAAEAGTAAGGYVDVLINYPSGIKSTVQTDGGDAAYAVTAAAVAGGFIYGAVTAGRTYTLPSAASIAAVLPNVKVGSTFEFVVCNNAAGANSITVACPASITNKGLAGHLAVAQNTRARYALVFTAADGSTADLLPV